VPKLWLAVDRLKPRERRQVQVGALFPNRDIGTSGGNAACHPAPQRLTGVHEFDARSAT
jgi:hypothetical protein